MLYDFSYKDFFRISSSVETESRLVVIKTWEKRMDEFKKWMYNKKNNENSLRLDRDGN